MLTETTCFPTDASAPSVTDSVGPPPFRSRSVRLCYKNARFVTSGLYVETAGNGYLVMSKSTWSGNLGDLSGADAKCLTELTTNTGWQGYTAANAGSQLVSGNVHAFLCDDSTCNNLQANATYYFANAANSSLGGASLGTNSSGEGYDLTDWTAPAYFGGDYKYWVGVRSQGSASYQEWGTTPRTSGGSCSNWGSSSSSNSGGVGGTNLFVWEGGTQAWADLVGTACNNTKHLICYVNP